MKKSGLADSPFFTVARKNKVATSPADKSIAKKKEPILKQRRPFTKARPVRHHNTMVSSNHATKTSRHHGIAIESIRKAVRVFGKEAATHRFTVDEKKAIREVVFTYENRDILTSANEITRISVNYALQDYKENGENSLLGKVLKALNK